MKIRTIIIILILLTIILLAPIVFRPKDAVAPVKEISSEVIKADTYTYTNHGFSIELPKGYVPKEEQAESGPVLIINLPKGNLNYWTNIKWWEEYSLPHYIHVKDEKIGITNFKVYKEGVEDGSNPIIYWFKQGNVGYEFTGDIELLKTFKFVGWPQVEGNKEDLVSFSIKPGQEVSGKMKVTGSVKGGYFFEGNILIGILDSIKEGLPYGPGHANATSDWMTAGPVSFVFDIDFSPMPKGLAYIVIKQDDPRDESERGDYKVKQILIPIIIK